MWCICGCGCGQFLVWLGMQGLSLSSLPPSLPFFFRYVKPKITPTSHLELLSKHSLFFNPIQLNGKKREKEGKKGEGWANTHFFFLFPSFFLLVFQALFQWRDSTARTEDESTRFVLANHMLFRFAEVIITCTL